MADRDRDVGGIVTQIVVGVLLLALAWMARELVAQGRSIAVIEHRLEDLEGAPK